MKNLKKHIQIAGRLSDKPFIESDNRKKTASLNIISITIIKSNGTITKSIDKYKGIAIDKLAVLAEQKLSAGSEIIIEGYIRNSRCIEINNHIKKVSEILIDSIKYRNIKYAIESNKTRQNNNSINN